jgi:pimeloyl-ACP methyl ester carboxylesterase
MNKSTISKILKWMFISLVLILVGIPLLLIGSGQLALDRDYQHTQATEALPLLSPGMTDGLVRIQANGFEFRARIAGLANAGPGLILLHGFPETSLMWEELIKVAAGEGYRVVAFDQRGTSPGARPENTADYTIAEFHTDVLAVADAVGFNRFHLAGHDWGSIVGYSVAGRSPERVLSWVPLSIPHSNAVAAGKSDNIAGKIFVGLFKTPIIGETFLTFGDMRILRNAIYIEMPQHMKEEYLTVFAEPGALSAALNWYRAVPKEKNPAANDAAPNIVPPVTWIWGNRDLPAFVHERVRQAHPRFVSGPYKSVEIDAGHWLMQEATEPVVDAIMTHLQTYSAAGR